MDQPLTAEADDPLAQPTRARLFASLRELMRPAGTAELAELLGLHVNGVRVHLGRLEQAGLVVRTRDPRPRGRPRDAWEIAPGARPSGKPPSAYSDLGRWLARTMPSRPGDLKRAEGTGRLIGRELAPEPTADPKEALRAALVALGFQPQVQEQSESGVSFCLGNCPYREAVRENQEVVCRLHRGITRGLLDELAPTARLESFVPHDPDAAGCEIEVSRIPRAAAG